MRAFLLCLKTAFISFFCRVRFQKAEKINYIFALRFELIFSIRPSMPSLKSLLKTQLFVTKHSLRYWMVASRQQSTGLGVSDAPQCSYMLLMDHVVARSKHEFEMEWSGMVSEALYLNDSWKSSPEKISNWVKPFISPLNLLVEKSTCPQVEEEAPEIYMAQLCVYRVTVQAIPKQR